MGLSRVRRRTFDRFRDCNSVRSLKGEKMDSYAFWEFALGCFIAPLILIALLIGIVIGYLLN